MANMIKAQSYNRGAFLGEFIICRANTPNSEQDSIHRKLVEFNELPFHFFPQFWNVVRKILRVILQRGIRKGKVARTKKVL